MPCPVPFPRHSDLQRGKRSEIRENRIQSEISSLDPTEGRSEEENQRIHRRHRANALSAQPRSELLTVHPALDPGRSFQRPVRDTQ
jgi:hypothetical protein